MIYSIAGGMRKQFLMCNTIMTHLCILGQHKYDEYNYHASTNKFDPIILYDHEHHIIVTRSNG